MATVGKTDFGETDFGETDFGETDNHDIIPKSKSEKGDGGALLGKQWAIAQPVFIWLAFWFAIALAIRFTNLATKPAWMDEVSTVMFSLGNSSRFIPTDQVISLDQILQGLKLRPDANAGDVVRYLLSENNHPPAYFVLAHWWMRLFHTVRGAADGGYASLWAARALPAVLGALAVPATYFLSCLSFRDSQIPFQQTRLIGLMSAALMAVSPFSVFLSQESRHYTLAILTIIASLCCFALAVRAAWERRPLRWLTVLVWVVINALSISVHYFCGIAICAEGLVLLLLLVGQCRESGVNVWRSPWPRIYVAAIGSLAGALIWLPILLNFYGSPQTTYIQSTQRSWKFWVDPIAQSVVGWLYAIFSPITTGFGWLAVTLIVVTCVLLLLLYTPWLLVNLNRALQFQWAQPRFRPGLWIMGGFFVMGNVLFFLICYVAGFDITRGHRYSFVYFPSLIVLVGACLAPFWQQPFKSPVEPSPTSVVHPLSPLKFLLVERFMNDSLKQKFSPRMFVATVVLIGFLGTQVIVYDLSHLKFYKANWLVNLVRENSTLPVVIGIDATVSAQPSVIGNEIVSVAWEVKRQLEAKVSVEKWVSEPQFIIAERNTVTNSDPRIQLIKGLKTVPRPFDLWVLNMSPSLESENCIRPPDSNGSKGSYRYTHYICERQSS